MNDLAILLASILTAVGLQWPLEPINYQYVADRQTAAAAVEVPSEIASPNPICETYKTQFDSALATGNFPPPPPACFEVTAVGTVGGHCAVGTRECRGETAPTLTGERMQLKGLQELPDVSETPVFEQSSFDTGSQPGSTGRFLWNDANPVRVTNESMPLINDNVPSTFDKEISTFGAPPSGQIGESSSLFSSEAGTNNTFVPSNARFDVTSGIDTGYGDFQAPLSKFDYQYSAQSTFGGDFGTRLEAAGVPESTNITYQQPQSPGIISQWWDNRGNWPITRFLNWVF